MYISYCQRRYSTMSNFGGNMNTLGGGVTGLRPGTTMRPGSQMRPGTNRLQAAGMGGSLQQPILVTAEAPVAREGMRAATRSGVGTSAGPGRQVGDRSYYIGILRPKINDLTTEIEHLKEQETLINKSSDVLAQLQQRAKSLTDEITTLKGTLSDVSFAVENSTSRDVRSLREEASKLEKANTERRKEVDSLFLTVKNATHKTKTTNEALENELKQLERNIINRNQDIDLYKTTRDEWIGMSDKVLEQQHEIRTLAAKQELLMTKLGSDPDKKRAVRVLRDILRKRREKEQLTKQCALSVEEEKQMMIKQVKTIRSDIEVVERQMKDMRDTIQESHERLGAVDSQIKQYSSENVQSYRELQEKDKELQKFVDEYPDRDRAEMDKIVEVQKNISALLTRISQAVELQRQMPTDGSPNAMRALTSEVDARRDQVRSDQKTHERLEKELLDRKAELNKVGILDNKIKKELEEHATKMAQQREDIARFSDLDGLREHIEKLRADLTSQKTYLTRVREGGKQVLSRLSAAYQADMKSLEQDEVYISLLAQEQKLRMLWQSTYGLDNFVRLKEKETGYTSTKAACLRVVDDINLILK